MNYFIRSVRAREVLDSRGNPTIEVEVITKGGDYGRATVPSGASIGKYEAIELRDGGDRFHGLGLLQAIKAVEEVIAPEIMNTDVREQRRIDETIIDLDGTDNKRRLGGNTILGVSLACAKAAAKNRGLDLYQYINEEASLLPIPFLNIINGGRHAGNELDFQEFMIVPTKVDKFKEAIRIGSEVYHTLKKQLILRYGKNAINVGDEGGFAPPMSTPEEALEAIIDSIEETGYEEKVDLALDVAASEFYDNGIYTFCHKKLSREELFDLYKTLVESYPIISIEDLFEEQDYYGFKLATKNLNIQILGDDLFVTNPERLIKGIEMGAANALLWKVNQIGTLTEALDASQIAKKNDYNIMASHRSGDTEDTFIADLAVGISCGQIKAGAPARGERTAKYNRLIRIEEDLMDEAKYPNNIF